MDQQEIDTQRILDKRVQETNKEIQEEFDRLSRIGVNALSSAEADFIRARRSYLSDRQLQEFESVLAKQQEKQEPKTGVNYKELQKRAADLGIKAVGVKKEELEQLVADAENDLKEEN